MDSQNCREEFLREMDSKEGMRVDLETDYRTMFFIISALQLAIRQAEFSEQDRLAGSRFVEATKCAFGPHAQRLINLRSDISRDFKSPWSDLREKPELPLGFRIQEIFAFLSLDDAGKDEGVCAFPNGIGTMPMVAADLRRVESLLPMAKEMVRHFGHRIVLAKFSQRSHIQIIDP